MAAGDLPIRWEAVQDFADITGLNSLADGDIFQTGVVTDASPTFQIVEISYEIVFAAGLVNGDYLAFYHAKGDEAASNEIWRGGIGETAGQITAAAAIAEVQAAMRPVHAHAWQLSHGTTFKGIYQVWYFGPAYQALVQPNGNPLAASGHRFRYRYGTPQSQAA